MLLTLRPARASSRETTCAIRALIREICFTQVLMPVEARSAMEHDAQRPGQDQPGRRDDHEDAPSYRGGASPGAAGVGVAEMDGAIWSRPFIRKGIPCFIQSGIGAPTRW